jgi:glycosyltransferase involved in cell wall biosynthesis
LHEQIAIPSQPAFGNAATRFGCQCRQHGLRHCRTIPRGATFLLLLVTGLVCLRHDCALNSGQTLRIRGFSFIRNGNFLGYPFVPAIRSLLPLCDEIIVNVPRSTDGTLEAVKSIGDPKIRIIQSDWDDNEKVGDPVMRRHTDLALEQCRGDWCVYIQGDEVLHEETIPAMRSTMERELLNPTVQGLLVDYTHFYGSFWTEVYSLGWYYKEIRVVRRDPTIRAWGGAQGFRTTDGQKLRVRNSGGRFFHYGYALEPNQARVRVQNLNELYGNQAGAQAAGNRPAAFYADDEKVKPFKGTHPAVMRELVQAATWTYHSRNPLIRFTRNYFWEDVALIIKRGTGITLGVHKNYRLIK